MKEKNNNGITLVALVVTIVILVILAGISIQAINNTGLFANAKQAKKKQEQAQELENSILTDYTGKISQYIDGKRGESSNESYNDLENVSRTFFSNNIINLKNRKSVVSTETTTATDLNKFDNYQFYLGTGEAPITGGFNMTAEYKGDRLSVNVSYATGS